MMFSVFFFCVVVVVGVGCGESTEVGTGTGAGLGSMSVCGRYAEFVSASNNSFTILAVSGYEKMVISNIHVHVDDSFCNIDNNYKLKVPTTKLKILGNKAFNLDGPSLFNTLPIAITTIQKVQGFKQDLKIF